MIETRKDLKDRIKELEGKLKGSARTMSGAETGAVIKESRQRTIKAPGQTGLVKLRADYTLAKAHGQKARRDWWDAHGEEYIAAVKASRAPRSEKIQETFEAMPPGAERTAFYRANRETFTK